MTLPTGQLYMRVKDQDGDLVDVPMLDTGLGHEAVLPAGCQVLGINRYTASVDGADCRISLGGAKE